MADVAIIKECKIVNHLSNLEENLQDICKECLNYGSEKCKTRKCNIGFALYVIQYAKESSLPILKDGEKLIPKDDIKYYDEVSIAMGISNICKLCRECNENHNEECVISLIRRSLENTQIKQSISYPGNILGYLMRVSEQNTNFAELIKEEYMKNT